MAKKTTKADAPEQAEAPELAEEPREKRRETPEEYNARRAEHDKRTADLFHAARKDAARVESQK